MKVFCQTSQLASFQNLTFSPFMLSFSHKEKLTAFAAFCLKLLTRIRAGQLTLGDMKHSFCNICLIVFREFMLAIYITSKGSPDEKLKWAFKVYDIDGNGTIEFGEMKRF